jgi:hypothetical protein
MEDSPVRLLRPSILIRVMRPARRRPDAQSVDELPGERSVPAGTMNTRRAM